jgi:antitoxin component YwqK of YwqJK toxin-antitoxin module
MAFHRIHFLANETPSSKSLNHFEIYITMKRLLFFAFLCLSFSISFGQVNITELARVEGKWTKEGESKPYSGDFVETYEDGSTKGTGMLVDGLLDGLRFMYYPNGNKSVKKYYKAGYPHGESKEFYDDGTLKAEGVFENNKEIGAWTLYHPNGKKHAVLTFDNGIQNGPYFEYSQEGVLIQQFYFKNGKAEYSDEFMALAQKGVELGREFKNEEAIEQYSKAIEENPTVAQVFFNRGTCKSNIFDFEGAIEDYDKAILLNPEYKEAYTNRASAKINIYTTKGNLFPSPEETASACEDLHKARELGDTSIGNEDLMYVHCERNKSKKKKKKRSKN